MKTKHVVSTQRTESASAQGCTASPRRILVVEDDGDIRRLNAEVLKCSGYEVDAAEDGAAGWAALDANGYDLLITDHDMPNVSGVDLLKKLHAARMDLPVIMATGSFPAHELVQRPWLQPAAMLFKPYTVEELLGTVREVLGANHKASTFGQTAALPECQSR
jgi:DNA-binding response OmpR family regulator